MGDIFHHKKIKLLRKEKNAKFLKLFERSE